MEESTGNLLVFISFPIFYIPANKLFWGVRGRTVDIYLYFFVNYILFPFALLTSLFWFYNEMKYYELTVGLTGLGLVIGLMGLYEQETEKEKKKYEKKDE